MDKFDKRLEATRKLVEVGMKLLVRIDQRHLALSEQVKSNAELIRSNAEQIKALTEAQRKTDRKFDRLIDSWTKRRTNGHPPSA